MHHLHPLIIDLCLILGAAAVVTLLFKRLKQPLVLGYIIAGMFVGPYFSFFPSVSDIENVELWAEIGVIFLLFSLGLEFSFKKLISVGGSSSITALVQITIMIVLGYLGGQALGWSTMDSIFLGATLSMSSTTIILRAFDELGVKRKKFAGLVFGALIIEDLVAIVLMVLLSTIAVSRQFAGWDMLYSILKLVFFLILWFVSGIFFIPTILKKAKSLLTDETMLILSLSLCFLMIYLADRAGFSSALGAFIMGSILAETTQSKRIEHLVTPIKDLFGAVFFVSVGMLINPKALVDYAGPIAVITVITLVGKTFGTALGALISGQPLKQSVQAGMSLAQIGEFSFIIATLGITLKVTSPFLYPVIVAVSAVTTFTTPYLIKASTPAYIWLERKLPQKWQASLLRYSTGAQVIGTAGSWKPLFRIYLVHIVIYSVLIVGVLMLASGYARPWIARSFRDGFWADFALAMMTVVALAPLLWALALRKIQPEAVSRLVADKRHKGPLLMLQLARIAIALFFVGMMINNLLSSYAAIVVLVLVLITCILNQKALQTIFNRIEGRFISNYNDKEDFQAHEAGTHLAPWDAHMSSFAVNPEFTGIGKSLVELKLRESLGINIAMIRRGTHTIRLPDRTERLYPDDILYVIGTDEQLDSFRSFLEQHHVAGRDEPGPGQDIALQHLEIRPDSEFVGKTIRESGVRERARGMIVGIERDGQRLLNPESGMTIQAGDMLWIVGNQKRIRLLSSRQDRSEQDSRPDLQLAESA